ncbi:hypothetical protein [Rahnella laticis]|uniref:hypothetical protein n=1 Tax=Rahnella laticis TaxID=2787622 RepID=UPI0018A2E33A|nr:hypothetical protein [Rahnella laticis]MBF7996398.1 hypothetical protein [Rahnella laticis]
MTFKLSAMIFTTAVVTSFYSQADEMQDPSILLVKKTVEHENLVSDIHCVDYSLTKNIEQGVDLVNILEKHGGKCGGDPQAQHRIFSVYVDQKTHEMASDKDDMSGDGNLTPLLPTIQK